MAFVTSRLHQKITSIKASVFFIFGSCNIHVLHAQHLPLKKRKVKLNKQSCKTTFQFIFRDYVKLITKWLGIKVKIPEDKHSHQSCSCRCGAHPRWFSGTRDCQSGWCWYSSDASVSIATLLQRPAGTCPLQSKRSWRSLGKIRGV